MEILVCFHHFLGKLRTSLCYQDDDYDDYDGDDEVSRLVSFVQMVEVDHVVCLLAHHIHASVKRQKE